MKNWIIAFLIFFSLIAIVVLPILFFGMKMFIKGFLYVLLAVGIFMIIKSIKELLDLNK